MQEKCGITIQNEDGSEFDMWTPWSVDLTDNEGTPIRKLVLCTHVNVGRYGKFTIRDGFTIEKPGMYGRILLDDTRKIWVCIAFNKDRLKLPNPYSL